MESHKSEYHTGFRVPYINGKYYVPALFVLGIALTIWFKPDFFLNLLTLDAWWHNIPILGFLLLALGISYLSYTRNFSLIPVLGLSSNFYLMTELGLSNWIGFSIWLIIGLLVYFSFGIKHAKLAK
jgi:hypothetical protein